MGGFQWSKTAIKDARAHHKLALSLPLPHVSLFLMSLSLSPLFTLLTTLLRSPVFITSITISPTLSLLQFSLSNAICTGCTSISMFSVLPLSPVCIFLSFLLALSIYSSLFLSQVSTFISLDLYLSLYFFSFFSLSPHHHQSPSLSPISPYHSTTISHYHHLSLIIYLSISLSKIYATRTITNKFQNFIIKKIGILFLRIPKNRK